MNQDICDHGNRSASTDAMMHALTGTEGFVWDLGVVWEQDNPGWGEIKPSHKKCLSCDEELDLIHILPHLHCPLHLLLPLRLICVPLIPPPLSMWFLRGQTWMGLNITIWCVPVFFKRVASNLITC